MIRGGLRTALATVALVAGVAVAASACAGGGPARGTPAPASRVPAGSGIAVASPGQDPSTAPASPLVGRLTGIDSEGLTRVRGFTLLSAPGIETAFTLGVLENGVEFPPGHLAEHLSTSSPVRVFFRDEGGALVVYRIEDAE